MHVILIRKFITHYFQCNKGGGNSKYVVTCIKIKDVGCDKKKKENVHVYLLNCIQQTRMPIEKKLKQLYQQASLWHSGTLTDLSRVVEMRPQHGFFKFLSTIYWLKKTNSINTTPPSWISLNCSKCTIFGCLNTSAQRREGWRCHPRFSFKINEIYPLNTEFQASSFTKIEFELFCYNHGRIFIFVKSCRLYNFYLSIITCLL